MNAQQTILKFLADLSKETFTIETIARQTNLAYHTVREALTKLRTVDYVQVTKGHWSITEVGIFEQERNPNFSLNFQLKPATNSRENWAELLGPEVINSPLGRHILLGPLKETFEQMLPSLRFLVLAWLVGEGIPVEFNALEEILEQTKTEDRIIEVFKLLDKELES